MHCFNKSTDVTLLQYKIVLAFKLENHNVKFINKLYYFYSILLCIILKV